MERKTRRKKTTEQMFQDADREGFYVKYLEKKGRAVFATRNFEKGDFLLWYKGHLVDGDEGEKREKREESVFRYFFTWMGKKWCCDATGEPVSGPKLARLCNHVYKNKRNSKMKMIRDQLKQPQLVLFALKDIDNNEEILYDYGVI